MFKSLFQRLKLTKPIRTAQSTSTRLHRLNNRLPSSLRRITTPILSAPLPHATSFLILHEITAVVPLFALVGVFHWSGWLPFVGHRKPQSSDSVEDDNTIIESTGRLDEAIEEGTKRFGRWLRKKGWVSDGEDGYGGGRLVLEFATAYAVTKMLLPVRIMFSVWATPWFSRRCFEPAVRWTARIEEGIRRRVMRRR